MTSWCAKFETEANHIFVVRHDHQENEDQKRRAYERGVQEMHRARDRLVLGPGRMKARTLSFSVIKLRIDLRFLQRC